MTHQTAKLEWRDGVPLAVDFDDPYFSLQDGLAETRHVFLKGNDLPRRMTGPFHIAELGFGTGLNFLVAWDAWRSAGQPGDLRFTSFEAFPMTRDDMRQALSAFPDLSDLQDTFLDLWSPDAGPVRFPGGPTLTVILGNAGQSVPQWSGYADAWFLDGFSPAKNPSLWDEDLIKAVAARTNVGGTAATYSAAGHVRRKLSEAGFTVKRTPGFGRKRHMTQAVLSDAK